MSDAEHMRHALALARRGLGRVAPNPAVGCVIVSRSGQIVGRGWTQPGGRPHAEAMALGEAGSAARGGTAYVTLEPCAHHGRTPPCAGALLRAGIARVVAAAQDPDPRVSGRGFDLLRAGGAETVVGVLEENAQDLNRGFILRIERSRPLVTLKIAQSRDGKTIPPLGGVRWITGDEARRFGHLLRARHDAILIGSGTALADDPMLDCRLPGLENRSPIRIVLDSNLRMPPQLKVFQTALRVPTIVFTAAAETDDALAGTGVEIIGAPRNAKGFLDLTAILGQLASRGITRLLIEGGPTIALSALADGYADRLEIFTAATILGTHASGDVSALIAAAQTDRFRQTGRRDLGVDVLESYAATA